MVAFDAGHRLTADELNAALGITWTDYNPTWGTGGTQPVLGNGTLAGRYTIVGNQAFVRVTLKTGSTTTYGTGAWAFSSPPSLNATYDSDFTPLPIWTGSALLRDASSGTYYAAVSYLTNVGTHIGVIYNTNTAGGMTSTVPFTWASGDFLTLTITYEIA